MYSGSVDLHVNVQTGHAYIVQQPFTGDSHKTFASFESHRGHVITLYQPLTYSSNLLRFSPISRYLVAAPLLEQMFLL